MRKVMNGDEDTSGFHENRSMMKNKLMMINTVHCFTQDANKALKKAPTYQGCPHESWLFYYAQKQ